jgi:hypothetical protein
MRTAFVAPRIVPEAGDIACPPVGLGRQRTRVPADPAGKAAVLVCGYAFSLRILADLPEIIMSTPQLVTCALLLAATLALVFAEPEDSAVDRAAASASESLTALTRILNP